MRTSKRAEILDAAMRVIQNEGVKAITYESVAEEAGLTKGGLVYHFTSRDELINAVHEHMASGWERNMVSATGKDATDATEDERLGGYARAAMQSATRAELLLFLEGVTTPEHAAHWNDVFNRWVPAPPVDASDAAATERFLARLAADGLWVYEALSSHALDPAFRQHIADLIASRITRSPAGAEASESTAAPTSPTTPSALTNPEKLA